MLKASAELLRKYFRRRHIAYNQVFNQNSVFVSVVLADLAQFCRAHESTFHKDERASLVMEGRREVWLRIQEHLQLSMEEIYSLHKVSTKGEEL